MVIVVSSMYILVADLDGEVLSAISVLLAVDVVSAQEYVCMQLAMSSFLKFCSLRNAVLVLVYLHNFMCVYIFTSFCPIWENIARVGDVFSQVRRTSVNTPCISAISRITWKLV